MSNRMTLPAAGVVNVAGLLAFGVMIIVQIAGGMDNYPTIPPGLVISIAVVALIVLGARWWWTAIAGALWPLFLTVGAIAATAKSDKSRFENMFVLTTTIVQMAFLATALIAGFAFAVQRLRSRNRAVTG
jgi:hypothetical protein